MQDQKKIKKRKVGFFMELEISNEMKDKTRHIAETEVAEEVLSQATGGGAMQNMAIIGGAGVLGTGVGAGEGAVIAKEKHAQGAMIGAGIGAVMRPAFGLAVVEDKEYRARVAQDASR